MCGQDKSEIGRDAAAAAAAVTTLQIFTSAFKLIDNNAHRLNMNY